MLCYYSTLTNFMLILKATVQHNVEITQYLGHNVAIIQYLDSVVEGVTGKH